MTPSTESVAAGLALPAPKPRLAYAIATVFGTGYLKPAPGTWGSLAGLLIAILCHPFSWFYFLAPSLLPQLGIDTRMYSSSLAIFLILLPSVALWVVFAGLGVWSGSVVGQYSGIKDPQFVVIDELSGVHLALILALLPQGGPATFFRPDDAAAFALYTGMSVLNWKYLLAAFILFRFFDILKPFPCRQLEKLPGGWGIMADDWMAGVYAAICLRLALHFYLL
jgi:phosphatidylglycerophosphatase A